VWPSSWPKTSSPSAVAVALQEAAGAVLDDDVAFDDAVEDERR
jgi:hypothetical protein